MVGVALVFAGTDWLARLVGHTAGSAGELVAGPVTRVVWCRLPALGRSAVLLVPTLLNGLRVGRYEEGSVGTAYAAPVARRFGASGGAR